MTYLGRQLTYQGEVDVDHKFLKCNYMSGTIKRTLKNKMRMETQFEIYNVMGHLC